MKRVCQQGQIASKSLAPGFKLFSFLWMVFSIGNYETEKGNYKYCCKNKIDSHLFILLCFRNNIKTNYSRYNSKNEHNNPQNRIQLICNDTAYKADSDKIFADIHQHFTKLFSPVSMFHCLIILHSCSFSNNSMTVTFRKSIMRKLNRS